MYYVLLSQRPIQKTLTQWNVDNLWYNILHSFILPFIHSSVFCLRASPSLQAQEPRLEFCRRQIFHRKLRNQDCSFTGDWIGAVASRCFPHHVLSLASKQTLKDLKDPRAPTWRWGEWIWLTWPSALQRNSPEGLNISSIGVFGQITYPKIPITLRPLFYIIGIYC